MGPSHQTNTKLRSMAIWITSFYASIFYTKSATKPSVVKVTLALLSYCGMEYIKEPGSGRMVTSRNVLTYYPLPWLCMRCTRQETTLYVYLKIFCVEINYFLLWAWELLCYIPSEGLYCIDLKHILLVSNFLISTFVETILPSN